MDNDFSTADTPSDTTKWSNMATVAPRSTLRTRLDTTQRAGDP